MTHGERTTRPRRGGFTLVELRAVSPFGRLGASRKAFTLVELTVVLALISLLAITVLPAALQLFNAGSDAQAYNTMTASLTAARAVAVEYSAYTVVRVQPAVRQDIPAGTWTWKDSDGEWLRWDAGLTFVTVLIYNAETEAFDAAPGFRPQAIPGRVVFGEVNSRFVSGNTFNAAAVSDANDFMSFNVIFSPSGSLVKKIPGMTLATMRDRLRAHEAFTDGQDGDFSTYQPAALYLRSLVAAEEGVTAMTMVYMSQWERAGDAGKRLQFLNDNGQLIPINLHTGRLLPRK